MAVIASEGFQPEPVLGFDADKSVQVIGYFLRVSGKPMDKMKLVKLIYLADRLSFERRGKALNFDQYFSMRNGPVVSSALDGMNGRLNGKAWSKIALGGDNITVAAIDEIADDRLSKVDVRILAETWESFGKMSAGQLRNWTHKHCPEYTEVEFSRISIDLDELMAAVGIPEADERAREQRSLQRAVGRLTRRCGA
jgi:uncharacterized phage-associated protein